VRERAGATAASHYGKQWNGQRYLNTGLPVRQNISGRRKIQCDISRHRPLAAEMVVV
jgi:hypothetical protein